MGEQQEPPLSPKFRATARMARAWDLTWAEAEDAVSHTTTGAMVLVEETIRELGRVTAKAARDNLHRILGSVRRTR